MIDKKKDTIIDIIKYLKENSVSDNEYYLTPEHFELASPQLRNFIPYDCLDLDHYLPEDVAETYNPDSINAQEFWRTATENFPLLSICGNVVKNKHQANFINFIGAYFNGLIDFVDDIFQKTPKAKILEIGPGYGALQKYLKMEYSDENYYGLDVVKLYDSKDKVIIGNGYDIPDILKNQQYDLFFSYNTFPHFSKEQRTKYLKSAYELLIPNGIFILTYPVAPNPLPSPQEYLQTKSGKAYYHFLGQIIEVPIEKEILKEFSQFKINIVNKHGSHKEFVTVVLTKPDVLIL